MTLRGAEELAADLADKYATLMPGAPAPKPDVVAAIDAAKERLGAQSDRRRDGMPVEQLTLGG